MTVADYQPFVERMLGKYEGGYGDPGGPTKYGITCYDLAEHRHQHMDSMARWAPIVQAMPLSEADDIIDVNYAKPCRFDDLGRLMPLTELLRRH
jgi:lysozyme family protein